MKKITIIFTGILLLFGMSIQSAAFVQAEITTKNGNLQSVPALPAVIGSIFPDPILAQAVASACGKNSSDLLTTDDVASITILSVANKGVTDLTGLEVLTNLNSLTLSGNNIIDITPISSLTKLIGVVLDNNKITDITPVSNLPKLVNLSINSNPINDITPVSTLPELKRLYAAQCNIADLSPVAQSKKLITLSVATNKISDYSPITDLTNLEILYISENLGSDLSPISQLINLKELYASRNNITDITPISNLKKLERITLYMNEITDIDALSNLSNIKFLTLNWNNIYNVEALSGLTTLTELYFRGNHIKDISPISSYYNNLTDKDFRDQTITLEPVKLYENVTISTEIINLDATSNGIIYNEIIPVGRADSGNLIFNGLIDSQQIQFNFSNGNMFTGTVKKPFDKVDVVVNYVDENGQPLLSQEIFEYDILESYSIGAKSIDGYTVEDSSELNGYANTQSKLTFVYIRNIEGGTSTNIDETTENNIDSSDNDPSLPVTGENMMPALVGGMLVLGSALAIIKRRK